MAGRPTGGGDVFKERAKALETLKLQLPLEDNPRETVQAFVELNPWAERKQFVTLMQAGRYDQGKEYLDIEIDRCKALARPMTKTDALAMFGLTRDSMGDPEDKLRRAKAKHRKLPDLVPPEKKLRNYDDPDSK